MPQSDPSRTEKATPKRRNKARQEGNVPRSQELNKLVVLVVGVILLRMTIGFMGERLERLFVWYLGHAPTFRMDSVAMHNLFIGTSMDTAVILLPVFLSIALAAVAVNIAQFGRMWSTKPLEPKFDKIFNIGSGLQKLFLDTQTIIRLLKGLGATLAVSIAPYMVLQVEMHRMLPLYDQSPEGICIYILQVSYRMVLYTLIPMILIAAADTLYTRWDYEENLKMTKDEVKDEHRQAEGDPKVKSKQKQKMLEMSQRRMLAAVPKADVVVTNPTHFAVALRYDPGKAPAPMVVAKGADHLARRIREAAAEHGVPVRENKLLARALYDQVEVGDVIPETLYKAVATLLAKLGRFRNRTRA